MNMNKRIIKGVVATAVAAVVVAGSFNQVQAAKQNTVLSSLPGVSITAGSNVLKLAANDSSKTAVSGVMNTEGTSITKEETVYSFLDPSGSLKQNIVSVWLKNPQKDSVIKDISELTGIQNVKGYESFEQNGDKVTWNAQGNDIYYQGTTEKSLPVEIKLTYLLDGTEINPEELIGKSGKVTIRYEYKNSSTIEADIQGKKEELYTPYLMVTGYVLPVDTFRNVEVTNGRLISDGDKQVVVGMTLPGLSESLKLKSDILEIPETFEITADVTDFSLSSSVTVAFGDILSELGVDSIDSIDELKDSIDQLTSGSYDLMNGAKELSDGILSLKEKYGEFAVGLSAFSEGMQQFKDALSSAGEGAEKLAAGSKTVDTGMGSLQDGLLQTKTAMEQINSNYGTITQGMSKLDMGAQSLDLGMDQLSAGIASANETYALLSQTVSNNEQLLAALKQINAVAENASLAEVITKLEANTAAQGQIAEGLTGAGTKLSAAAGELQSGSETLAGSIHQLSGGISSIAEGSSQVGQAVTSMYEASGTLKEGTHSVAEGVAALNSGTKQLSTAADSLISADVQLMDGSSKIQDGIGLLADGSVQVSDGARKLYEEGIKKLSDVMEEDLNLVFDRLNAMTKNGKEAFSGKTDTMDGNVKFIMKTDAIGE